MTEIQPPKRDPVDSLNRQIDELERKGGGDPRVVERLKETRRKLDALRQSMETTKELERIAAEKQKEFDRRTRENQDALKALPATRVKVGGVLTFDGKTYQMPATGSLYARKNFTAVREGDEWVVRPSVMEGAAASTSVASQPEKKQNLSPEKAPMSSLRVKVGGVLTFDGKTYQMPATGSLYARKNFTAVREGDEWVVTPGTIE